MFRSLFEVYPGDFPGAKIEHNNIFILIFNKLSFRRWGSSFAVSVHVRILLKSFLKALMFGGCAMTAVVTIPPAVPCQFCSVHI